jgi:hypothetical protein
MKKTLIFLLAALSFTFCIAQQNDWTNGENVFGKNNSGNNLSRENIQKIDDNAMCRDTTNPQQVIKFDFEKFELGKLPNGWSQYYSGSGGTDWKVADDKGNKVLAQLYSDNPNNHFNIVVNDNITAKDMILTVRLNAVKGKHDQGGGFVWRFKDKNNYYLVRSNPLEKNVVLYKVQNGTRTDLPLVGKGRTYGVDVVPMGNNWHDLKLVVNGSIFTVFLNDKELFKVQDSTFPDAGKVGLWSKSDAVSYFDDFIITIMQ